MKFNRDEKREIKKYLIILLILIFLKILVSLNIKALTANAAEIKDTMLSNTAYQACITYGEEYGICPELLMAIIETESGGKADAQNGSCVGLLQISEKWHKSRMKELGVTDLMDEESNILVGCDYLSELFEEYEDAALVLMIYHGEKNAITNWEKGDISSYALRILSRSAELEEIHGK